MKFLKLSAGLMVLLLVTIYGIFFFPIGPEIYFEYKVQYSRYDNGEVEFRLVNDNPENGFDRYYFRVAIQADPEFYGTCDVDSFDWELIRLVDNAKIYSTSEEGGIVKPEHYFENKIDGQIFKGIVGTGLGESDFKAIVSIDKNNGCGLDADNLSFTKTLRLRRKKASPWDAAMSV